MFVANAETYMIAASELDVARWGFDRLLAMPLHFKSRATAPGVYPVVKRGHELKHLSFTILELGESFPAHELESGVEEISLDFYTGPVRVEVASPYGDLVAEVPRRRNLRDAHAMVYVPQEAKVRLTALDGAARVTIAGALGKPQVGPVHIGPEHVVTRHIGKDNWTRDVHTHIADNVDAAHLICGETVNAPGGWSSCPPHKHDVQNPPQEVPMEEIYYFQCDPPQGFGFMRVYTDPDATDPFDYAYPVEHGDTVIIPRGYHPVVACPGYTLNYTWILAGEGRTYGAWSDDPKHAWIKG